MTNATKWTVLMAAIAMCAFAATGCVVAQTANIYDVCSGTEECPGNTTCQTANTTTDGYVGRFCTFPCNVDADCPGDGFATPACEAGQCYAGCAANASCPYAETCATDGAVLFCVP
jgi:hypothetical protein